MRSTTERTMGGAGLLLVAALLGCAATGATAQDNSYQKDGKAAAAFCARPAFKSQKCGFVTAEEAQATINAQCPLCGTSYTGLPSGLPADFYTGRMYDQYGTEVISLACKGRVVVRSVFKVTEASAADAATPNCTRTRLEAIDAATKPETVRCVLQLPSGPGSEEERALRAKEGPCYICGGCSDAGCPFNLNTWYSDTVLTTATGCDFDRSKGYQVQRMGIRILPSTKIRLAKFEVCNDAGCFNAAYEDAKLKSARKCVRGVCPKP